MKMVKPFIKQAWVVSGVLLMMVQCGMCLGFTTCLLPALRDPDSDIRADLAMSSWIAATFGFAWIPGFFFNSYYMDKFGRRKAFLVELIPGGLGLVLMYFATNVHTLIVARALEGLTTGATTILGAIVIGEYTDPVHRGMFLNLKTAAIYVGSAVAHVLGNYYHWRSVTLITLIPFIINVGVVWMWPESPSWLAAKDEFEKSEIAFYWLRGKTEHSTRELKQMLKAQQERVKLEKLSCGANVMVFLRKFKRRDFIMPVLIYVFAAILLEATGRHIFPAYAVQIISEISGSQVSFYYTLFMDVLISVSALFSSVLIKMFKRRTLLFTTGTAAFVVLMLVCVYLFLVSRSIIVNIISIIPLGLFALFLAIVNFACAPIPLALIGEIFPLEHRAAGTTMAGLLVAIASIITLKTTPVLLATVKVYGTFSILGIVMAISLVFLYFLLPETKDRTLQEIEDYFNYGVFKADDRVQDDKEGSKMIS